MSNDVRKALVQLQVSAEGLSKLRRLLEKLWTMGAEGAGGDVAVGDQGTVYWDGDGADRVWDLRIDGRQQSLNDGSVRMRKALTTGSGLMRSMPIDGQYASIYRAAPLSAVQSSRSAFAHLAAGQNFLTPGASESTPPSPRDVYKSCALHQRMYASDLGCHECAEQQRAVMRGMNIHFQGPIR